MQINGIKNFLELINNNWTTIMVVCGLCVSLYYKIMQFIKLSDDEKINQTKTVIKNVMLSLVSDAELNYSDWNKSGAIKRAEVINKIFTDYPILNKVTDKEKLISEIDGMLDESLKEMRNIIR